MICGIILIWLPYLSIFFLFAFIFVLFFCSHSGYLKTFFHDKGLTFSHTYFIPYSFSFYKLNLQCGRIGDTRISKLSLYLIWLCDSVYEQFVIHLEFFTVHGTYWAFLLLSVFLNTAVSVWAHCLAFFSFLFQEYLCPAHCSPYLPAQGDLGQFYPYFSLVWNNVGGFSLFIPTFPGMCLSPDGSPGMDFYIPYTFLQPGRTGQQGNTGKFGCVCDSLS